MSNILRRLCAILCIFSVITALSACGRTDSPKNLTYTASYLPLPEGITGITRFRLTGSTAYLCCIEDEASYIASADIASGDFRKLQLGFSDDLSLLDFVIGDDGEIWVLCRGDGLSLRKYDSTGTEIKTVELEGVIDETYFQYYLSSDSDGNIAVVVKDAMAYLYLFDAEGSLQFELDYDGTLLSAITTAEGKIGLCARKMGQSDYKLLTVDMQNKAWSKDTINLGTVTGLYGGTDNSFLLYDISALYGYDTSEAKRQELFSWSQVGLNTGDVHICEMPDGGYAVVSASSEQSSRLTYDLAVLTLGEDNRTALSMVSLSASPAIVQAISQFNRTNADYRVELTEYFPYDENVSDGDWENAIMNLNTKIIAGEIPDIIDMSELTVGVYYAKGIVEDIYPYLENDPSINMDDYFENLLDAMRIDGAIAYVTNGVSVHTMIADSSILESNSGWTFDEFESFVKENGAAALGNMTSRTLLRVLMMVDDSFVDWSKGECYFDSQKFIRLLELANAAADKRTDSFGMDTQDDFIATYGAILSVYQIAQYRNAFGGDLNTIGFPSDGGVYYAISPETKIGISTTSNNKDGAWQFVRSFLEEKQQESCYSLPIRKASFEKVMSEAIDGKSIWSFMYEDVRVTECDVDITYKLLENANYIISDSFALEDIAEEEAEAYFSGKSTVEDVAAKIQNRAKIYVNERM